MNLSLSNMRVDTHFHIFPAHTARLAARYVPQYSALLDDWREQARREGLTHGVLVQPSFLGADNRVMLDALNAHQDMLRGVAVVEPTIGLEELVALHQSGVRGIRLNLAGVSHEIHEWARASRVWEYIHAAGWHLELHTDHGKLPHVLNQLPSDVPLVVDHMGKPASADSHDPSLLALKKRADSASIYVKLSGAYRLGGLNPTVLAKLLLDELGHDALLWGSVWPCTNHEQFADLGQLIRQSQDWVASNHQSAIMSRNPMRLYWGAVEDRRLTRRVQGEDGVESSPSLL